MSIEQGSGIIFYSSEGEAIEAKGGGKQKVSGCKGNKGEGMEQAGSPGAAVPEPVNS
jgi:hypothetical protein